MAGQQVNPFIRAVRYINPCDIDRCPLLAPIGDACYATYKLYNNVDCDCCKGMRIIATGLVGIGVGIILGVSL